jgi:hypothetical protein
VEKWGHVYKNDDKTVSIDCLLPAVLTEGELQEGFEESGKAYVNKKLQERRTALSAS